MASFLLPRLRPPLAAASLAILALACGRDEAGPPAVPVPETGPTPAAGEGQGSAEPVLPEVAGRWQGDVDGVRLLLEARPGPAGTWELVTPPESGWRLRRSRSEGGVQVLDLRHGEGLAARDLRLRLSVRPGAERLEGEARAGARRLPVLLDRA